MKRIALVISCLVFTACGEIKGWKIDIISEHCQSRGGVGHFWKYADGGGMVTCADGSDKTISELRKND